MKLQVLDVRHNPINLFSISKLKKEFNSQKESLLMINGTWQEV